MERVQTAKQLLKVSQVSNQRQFVNFVTEGETWLHYIRASFWNWKQDMAN